MGIGVNVIGIPKVSAMLSAKNTAVKVAAQAAITQSGFFVEGELKDSIAGHKAEPRSVDTGRFLSSVHALFPKPMSAIIKTDLDYPIILELGGSNRAPRHHFRNTTTRSKAKVKRFVDTKIKAVI